MKKQLKKKLGKTNNKNLMENINNMKNNILENLSEDQRNKYILKQLFKEGNPTLEKQQEIKNNLHKIILENQKKNTIDEDEFENLEEINSDESCDEN